MGGAGKPEHIANALKKNIVTGVITANLFNFLDKGLEEARKNSLSCNINLANFSSQIEV